MAYGHPYPVGCHNLHRGGDHRADLGADASDGGVAELPGSEGNSSGDGEAKARGDPEAGADDCPGAGGADARPAARSAGRKDQPTAFAAQPDTLTHAYPGGDTHTGTVSDPTSGYPLHKNDLSATWLIDQGRRPWLR